MKGRVIIMMTGKEFVQTVYSIPDEGLQDFLFRVALAYINGPEAAKKEIQSVDLTKGRAYIRRTITAIMDSYGL